MIDFDKAVYELDNYLKIKLTQYSNKYNTEKKSLFQPFYNHLGNTYLIDIFSILHSNINDLFEFLNYKNSSNGHYNAEDSRQLLDIIEQIKTLQAKLTNTYKFKIDNYYSEIIYNCKKFLSMSGGSTIPDGFQNIDIIEERAIFIEENSAKIENSSELTKVPLRIIGGGSYANVFKYKDPHYKKKFAIKRAHENLREDELERFKHEFHDLKQLDSPFIIKAYTYNDEINEYTMEFADYTLHQYIKKSNNSLTFESRRKLIIQLLNAFEYIHNKGLLHRDVSYHNILIKKYEDGNNFIKVSDFGLVKRPESNLTRQGTEIKGAINDYSDLDRVGFENYEIRHETYALAKVIYFILTGRETNYHKEHNEPLKNFILKALSDKENRFDTVAEMRKFLVKDVFPWVRNS